MISVKVLAASLVVFLFSMNPALASYQNNKEQTKYKQSVSKPSKKTEAKKTKVASSKLKSKKFSASNTVFRKNNGKKLNASHDYEEITKKPTQFQSYAVLMIDQDSQEIVINKNEQDVLPIASLTKLMTGLVISESKIKMDEQITVTHEDVDTERNSRSRLPVGTTLSRSELLKLALMSSENRAAYALARTFPGGFHEFVLLMNEKARSLGMINTRYVEPTGLSSSNTSTASDLAVITKAAYKSPMLRQLTTSIDQEVKIGSDLVQFRTTNEFVRNQKWKIGLQKTGFINEAGRCLLMQTTIAGRRMIMVLLDSPSSGGRSTDAKNMMRWVQSTTSPQIKR